MKAVCFLLLLGAAVQAVKLSVDSVKYSIISAKGEPSTKSLSPTEKSSSEVVTISQDQTLKLSFQVVDKVTGKGVQPEQAFLRFYDEQSGEEGIQPVRVTSSGKAKFDLSLAKPPASLPPTSSAPLKVTLLLGASSYAPAKLELFNLHIPASHPAPTHPDEAKFHILPELAHTFRPDPKLPARAVSALFAGLVLVVPWTILLGLWFSISPRVPRLFSPNILPFTASLGAFEFLLYRYWVDLKLGDVLTYGAMLGIVTVFTGRHALASIADRRLGNHK
ncbi:oligosaccharyl transferase delta subunit [Lentinula edodes]|uniref:oligosaccharyl transferase delta subunit n=1 Tax=Lentinula edodes TaxID=5353 RepID=UPI001E8D0232|nr:oligosaccharyl transferase delta subunit [Lentinula edodes]KAH7878717.1 oligosaccharyl transferase delta subunit [Lentinula edodes]